MDDTQAQDPVATADVPVVKRKAGRPLGSKTKKGTGEPLRGVRLREAINRAITPERLEVILKKLSPSETARLLASLEPKMREEGQQTVIRVVVSGFPAACPHCGGEIPPEMEVPLGASPFKREPSDPSQTVRPPRSEMNASQRRDAHLPPRRVDVGVPEVTQTERDAAAAEARLDARKADDRLYGRCLPITPPPGSWDGPASGGGEWIP